MYDSALTVTVPATATALTTIDAVRDELYPFGLTDTSLDGYLMRLIKRVSDTITSWIDRPLGLQTYQQIFTPRKGTFVNRAQGVTGDTNLMLGAFPIVSLISATNFAGTIDPTLFNLDMDSGIIRPAAFFGGGLWSGVLSGPLGGPPLTFTFQGGYDLANSIPGDLESVALDLITTSWTRRGRDAAIQLTVLGENVGRTAFFDHGNDKLALSDDMQDKLNGYRQLRL